MTVCIAAGCKATDDDRCIVLCADWKSSSILGSSETHLKQRSIKRGWNSLTSGNNSDVLALLSVVEKVFLSHEKVLDDNISGVCREVVKLRKLEKIEEYIGNRLGISYMEFMEHGKIRFSETTFREAERYIANISIGAAIILAGFDENGFPLLCEVGADGSVSLREDFAAIGEGSYLAKSVLLQRGHMDVRSLERTIYCIYEAKKYAESIPSVGSATLLTIARRKSLSNVSDSGFEWLDQQYKKYGPQRLGALSGWDSEKFQE